MFALSTPAQLDGAKKKDTTQFLPETTSADVESSRTHLYSRPEYRNMTRRANNSHGYGAQKHGCAASGTVDAINPA